MILDNLLQVKTRTKKRVGRGVGSGKGKTSGRGTKGQKARGKIPVGFTGSLSLYKKLPLRRGQGNSKVSSKVQIINLGQLNVFKTKTVVDISKLVEANIISEKEGKGGIKVLGNGELKSALIIKLLTSKAARQKIEKAGGKVEDV